MHRAREKGRNAYEFFAPEMNQRGLERMHLERGLRRALERGEFLLHYQPKIVRGHRQALRRRGAAALATPGARPGAAGGIRSHSGGDRADRARGLVGVGDGLRAAAPLGAGRHSTSTRVGINLSARQFRQLHFDAHMRRIIESSGLAPGKIELEITESMLMHDPAQAIQTLTRLKQSGVSVAVDDFGTGYSGLSYLKQLPSIH